MKEENMVFGEAKKCKCCGRMVEPTPDNFADVEYIDGVGHVCTPCRYIVRPYVDSVEEARVMGSPADAGHNRYESVPRD